MWNDLVTWFNAKVAVLNGRFEDGEKLIYYCLPMAAFVFVAVKLIKKGFRKKQGP